MGGPKASEISELRRMAKWRENPEEIKGEDELLTGEELKLFQSVAVQFHILAMDRVDLMSTVEESMRKMASPRARDLAALKRIARFTINNLRMAGRYPQTGLDRNILECLAVQTLLDEYQQEIHRWRSRAVEWPVCEGYGPKTTGSLPLRSGESELATVVRAPTEGMGFQSTLSDFSLRGHVGQSSRMPLLRLGWSIVRIRKSAWRKFESPKCQGWRIGAMYKQCTLGQNHCCVTRKHATYPLAEWLPTVATFDARDFT